MKKKLLGANPKDYLPLKFSRGVKWYSLDSIMFMKEDLHVLQKKTELFFQIVFLTNTLNKESQICRKPLSTRNWCLYQAGHLLSVAQDKISEERQTLKPKSKCSRL